MLDGLSGLPHHVVDKPNCPNSSPQKLRQYFVPPHIPVHVMHMTIRHITFLIGCVLCVYNMYTHTHTLRDFQPISHLPHLPFGSHKWQWTIAIY